MNAGRRQCSAGLAANNGLHSNIEHRHVARICSHEQGLFEAMLRPAQHRYAAVSNVVSVANRAIAYRALRYGAVEARQPGTFIHDPGCEQNPSCSNFRCVDGRHVAAVRAAKIGHVTVVDRYSEFFNLRPQSIQKVRTADPFRKTGIVVADRISAARLLPPSITAIFRRYLAR